MPARSRTSRRPSPSWSQSLQTPQVLRGILLIDRMPDGLTLADINALSKS
jgi:hypothetical protein